MASIASFGVFELNLNQPELRRNGSPVELQQQSMLLLTYLVERHGSLVSREELRSVIWPSGTFVEFDLGLNAAINRLRRSLGDSAAEPRYIETLPKQGYRFIAPVEVTSEATGASLASAEPAIIHGPPNRWRLPPSLFSALAIAIGSLVLATLAVLAFRSQPAASSAQRQIYRFAITLPEDQSLQSFAISPSGEQIVYEAARHGSTMLYRRYLDEEEFRSIPGTEDGHAPFFSPEGESFGFYTPGKLKIAETSGIRTVAAFSPTYIGRNAIWGEDDFIYFNARYNKKPRDWESLWRVPAHGGAPKLILNTVRRGRGMEFPFASQIVSRDPPTLMYSVDFGPMRRSLHLLEMPTQKSETLIAQGVGGQLLPTGHLLYYWRGSLFAVPFNLRQRHLSGSPIEVLKGVAAYSWARPQASVSRNGTLVYLPLPELPQKRLEWIDQTGRSTPLAISPGAYEQAEVSPDGRRLAVVRQEEQNRWALLTYDLRTGEWNRLLESAMPQSIRAIWSPDSAFLVVASEQENGDFPNLIRVSAAAPSKGERLTNEPDFGQFPQSWSGKANAILFMEGVHPDSEADILVLPLSGDRRPRTLVATSGWDRAPVFSPDGDWIAYESNTSGKSEVYLQRYDRQDCRTSGPVIQISRGEGRDPIWTRDGAHLIYTDEQLDLTRAEVPTQNGIIVSSKIAKGPFYSPDGWTRAYSIAPDGRLLVIRPANPGAEIPQQIHVVVNWFEELKRLSPVSN